MSATAHDILIVIKVLIVFGFIFWGAISLVYREYCDSWFEAVGIGLITTLLASLTLVAVSVLLSILFM